LGFRGPWETPEPQERERPGLRPSPSTSGNLLGFRGPRENVRATRARASGAPPMHPQDWTKFFLGYFRRHLSTPEPKSPSVLASAHASPRVETHINVHIRSVWGSGVFCHCDLPSPPSQTTSDLFYFKYFFLLKSKSSSILQGCVDPGLLALVPRVRTRDTTDSSSSSSAPAATYRTT
jgi:hypothetical protein